MVRTYSRSSSHDECLARSIFILIFEFSCKYFLLRYFIYMGISAITNVGWVISTFGFKLNTSIWIVRFYIYVSIFDIFFYVYFWTLCYYVMIDVFHLTNYMGVILLYYRGRKKVWAWRHERWIIAIWSRRNDILFYATALTRFLPCVCIYIHMLFLFSSLLHLTSYFQFRGRNFLKGQDCDDPLLKIIIFISEFMKMPFEANALTFVDWCVLSCKTHFLGISS